MRRADNGVVYVIFTDTSRDDGSALICGGSAQATAALRSCIRDNAGEST
ncbi:MULTISPECIES: hypothetical protein [Corynebacterium]|nr:MULTISPECIES: hypothetical protein [Corynebacterium]MDN8624393.1 hypothetical protein [Corynebacterium kroppenstedtii]QRQ65328.1 hypothetical protein I6J23_02315 [Corynebacterium kroppenstedtii]